MLLSCSNLINTNVQVVDIRTCPASHTHEIYTRQLLLYVISHKMLVSLIAMPTFFNVQGEAVKYK